MTHIDDCHVLVIQEGGHTGGLDYDKFIISKIREIRVRFQPRPGEEDLQTVDISLDPNLNIDQVRLIANFTLIILCCLLDRWCGR